MVVNGNRHKQLYKDAIQFKHIFNDGCVEHLIFALIQNVLTFYDNTDGDKDVRKLALKINEQVMEVDNTTIF